MRAPLLCLVAAMPLLAGGNSRQMTPWAPPVIPHAVERGTACTDCHGVEGSGAPDLPHRMIPNCMACHLEQTKAKAFRPNRFRAEAERPGPNRSRIPGAPPAIPHHVRMRERCLACHGSSPRHGAKAPHPDRVACTQCHLPSGAGE
ncbi:MAG TPA: hypothetical protein VF768_04945 [Holophagaceae bacterium]